MTVFIIVFAIGAALFFGLRHWDKRARAQRALLVPPEEGESLGDKIEANVDNLEFAAEKLLHAVRRPKADDGDSGGDGGGDGG